MATPNRFFFRWQSTAVESFGRGTVEAAHALYVKNGAALRYKAPVVRYHGGVAQSVATTAVDQLPDQSVVYARVLTPTQLALYSSKAAAVQGGPGGLISKGVAEQARLTELLDEAERGSFFFGEYFGAMPTVNAEGLGPQPRGFFSSTDVVGGTFRIGPTGPLGFRRRHAPRGLRKQKPRFGAALRRAHPGRADLDGQAAGVPHAHEASSRERDVADGAERRAPSGI